MIQYCLVCGYDFSRENSYVKRFEFCPCCLFEYGLDDCGEINAYVNYREDWLNNHFNKKNLIRIGIKTLEDFIGQFKNINKINLNDKDYDDLTADNDIKKIQEINFKKIIEVWGR